MLKYNGEFIKNRIIEYLKFKNKIGQDGGEEEALKYIKTLTPEETMVLAFQTGEFYYESFGEITNDD